MAAYAAVVFHVVEPLSLRHLRGDTGLLAPELIRGWNFQHGVPVDRRIVARCRGFVGSQRCGEVQLPAWFGHHFRTIHEAVAAHPHVVRRLWQIGNEVAAPVVGDDDLGVSHRQIPRLGDHPDARLGSIGARYHATDVIAICGHGGSPCDSPGDRLIRSLGVCNRQDQTQE